MNIGGLVEDWGRDILVWGLKHREWFSLPPAALNGWILHIYLVSSSFDQGFDDGGWAHRIMRVNSGANSLFMRFCLFVEEDIGRISDGSSRRWQGRYSGCAWICTNDLV